MSKTQQLNSKLESLVATEKHDENIPNKQTQVVTGAIDNKRIKDEDTPFRYKCSTIWYYAI